MTTSRFKDLLFFKISLKQIPKEFYNEAYPVGPFVVAVTSAVGSAYGLITGSPEYELETGVMEYD